MIDNDWTSDPYLPAAPQVSVDNGTTNLGPLWHVAPSRWGHSMHTMCPYQGMYPPRLVHYFVQRFSQPGSLVVDPFSGRGTTLLQSAAEGRQTRGNDLNPLAFVLSKAKSNPPPLHEVLETVEFLRKEYKIERMPHPPVSPDIAMLFHPRTLSQICFIRSWLAKTELQDWDPLQLMIAGSMAGILHGGIRSDGSSQFLSISMPNTFSMSPAYVQRYISENDLVAPDQDVFARLEEKMARLYVDQVPEKGGSVEHRDAADFLRSRDLRGRADLILTSPPYLKVVNYGTSNWIRLWWLGVEDVGRQHGEGRRRLDTDLDHGHGYVAYRDFMLRILQGVQQALSTNGVAALVIGDVASPGEESLDLANQLWTDVGDYLNLDLLCLIEDDLPSQSKVSRIWGDTRGEATNRDCILLLARPGADPVDNPEVDWSEPYRDAGPDLAHEILNRTKRR